MRVTNCTQYDTEDKYNSVKSDPCRVLHTEETETPEEIVCTNEYCRLRRPALWLLTERMAELKK